MSLPFRVTLQGFSAFERSALASYFRLAANRNPAYEQVDTAGEAHFIVVDADDADAVRGVLAAGRAADTVFVGALAPQGATAWVMRPIDPLHVMRELDAMVSHKASHRAAARAAQTAGSGHSGSHAPAPVHGGRTITIIKQPSPGPVPARRSSDGDGLLSASSPAEAHQPLPPAPARRGTLALLVDDSEIALRFLETRLQRLGLQTESAATSAKAIELLSRTAYDFVFLDVELGDASELDGLALCQHIKRHHHHVGGGRGPVVVMVSAHHSELDRVRGTLAGADAYLGKPLDEAVIQRLLHQNGLTPPTASEPTRIT